MSNATYHIRMRNMDEWMTKMIPVSPGRKPQPRPRLIPPIIRIYQTGTFGVAR